MKELGEFAAEEDAKAALHRALRKLEKAKSKQEELIAATYQATRDALAALEIPPVPEPPKDPRRKSGETAVAILSDWQLAKITPSYSTSVCERRIERYADKVLELTEIQRADHPVRDLRVYLLGDLVEGEMIFPGQAHQIDASLFRQTHVDGPRILGNFLRRMAANFDSVHVVGVIGNHGAIGGRARKEYHPESNADAMLYEVTRLALGEQPRLTWAPTWTEGQRHWFSIDTVGTKTFMLIHGDQIRGYNGIPWYGFDRRVSKWHMMYGPFDYMLAGHFHTPTRMYINGVTVWENGSTESDNPYAAEQLAASGEPSQWLLFAHPRQGVTAEFLVRLSK
jgi:hypothetical protein